MIEVMLKKHGKVILHEICSDVQFLHQIRYRLLPGEKGKGIWTKLLLDHDIPKEKRKYYIYTLKDGSIMACRYV